jgi:Na+:H+ antiporter, NhaA family
VADFLREETTGGKLLLAATAIALVWANLAGHSYDAVWGFTVGPHALHLHLSLADWAADGLLAVFFFVAGVELKRELVAGELADRRAAALPVLAAIGGMAAPALVAIAVSGGKAAHGGAWAIPVATDIAFALGVLALAGAALPGGVRVLLLAIAVIDDLLAIALIAIVFTHDLAPLWLVAGLVAVAAFREVAKARARRGAVLLVAIAVAAWICVNASGVHPTVAGILLGLATPLAAGDRLQHRVHPFSAGIAVPLFALASTGIAVSAIRHAPDDAIAVGVFAGLLVGKPIGILGGARAAVALRIGALPAGLQWADVVPVAILGAIGYTVSLLIAHLALPTNSAIERADAAILAASVTASTAAVLALRHRSRRAARGSPR